MWASRKAEESDQRPLLFICQDSVTLRRENLRAIVSHARKTQTRQKHNRKRVSAQKDATYARSLVGWQQDRTGVQQTTTLDSGTRPDFSQIDKTNESRAEHASRTLSTKISPSLGMRRVCSDGLRIDPFASFPLDNSDEAMRMIDFCTLSCTLPVYRVY